MPQPGAAAYTDRQKGKIWFEAKDKLGLDADSPEFNDLMVLRFGVALPMLTKGQASDLIKMLTENPQELQAQLPKSEALVSPAADYWLNRLANAPGPEMAGAIHQMIRGRYSKIATPYGDMLADELKRWGIEA